MPCRCFRLSSLCPEGRSWWSKSMMRFVSSVLFATIGLVSVGLAADFGAPPFGPPPPAFSWTGCYVGAAVGGAWSSQDASNTAFPTLDQAGVTGTIHASGVIGGGFGGCNFQWTSAWVIGIEGDWSGTSLSGSATGPDLFANGTPANFGGGIAWTDNLSSIATLRGRIGYAWNPNILAYFTGGGAWGRISYSSVDAFAPVPLRVSLPHSPTPPRVGWWAPAWTGRRGATTGSSGWNTSITTFKGPLHRPSFLACQSRWPTPLGTTFPSIPFALV
jgi:opacity protein-like surface antigen